MSVWKSPLLIFGILLILAAGALGFGPLFVNWNTYKADFQREASLITGRDVTIDGPVTVRLFPWPRLTARDVRISNPAGALVADLVHIESIDAEVAVAPLLSGQIALRKVKLVRPVFSAERMAGGGVNWKLNPVVSLAGLPGAEQIAVAGIDIEDGKLFFGDGRRGGLSELTGLQGRLKAPSLDGPWRADLTAEQSGSPLKMTVSTSKYREGKPLKVSAAITPTGNGGFLWSFDGETLRDDGKISGRLSIRPAARSNGKADPLNSQWQVELSADVEADFDTIALTKIEVVPANDLTGSNLMTGSATITLGRQLVVATRLDAAQIDLDKLAGRNLFEQVGGGALLHAVSDVLQGLPTETEARFETSVTSLIAGGQTLSKVSLSGQMTPQALRISRISADLPGQTRTSFSGVLLPAGTSDLPQLAGEVNVQSGSLRDFVAWARPDSAETIQKVWSGARGRLGFTAQLGWTPDTLRLSAIKATLDDASTSGSFRIAHGDIPSLNIRLLADSLNIDRYAPRGFSTSAMEDGTLAGLSDLAATAIAFGDTQITIQTDTLLMHGVEAKDIAVDIDVSEGAIELRTVQIGGIGDARLDMAGVLNFPDEGITGSLSGEFRATDPRPFLRLAGVLDPSSAQLPWASRLGPVDLKVLSEVSTTAHNNKLTLSLSGTTAGATVALSGGFDGKFSEWRDGDTQVSASATGTTSAGLLALAGLEPVNGGDGPASFRFAYSGKPSAALSGSANLSLLGADIGFDGGLTVEPAGSISAAGTTTLKAGDAVSLVSALGLTAPGWPDHIQRTIDARADAVFSYGTLKLDKLEASLPLNTISGNLTIAGSLRHPVIDGNLLLANLEVPWLASALVMAADGKPVTAGTTFDTSRLGWVGKQLKISAQRAVVLQGLSLADGNITLLRPDADTIRAALSGTTGNEAPFLLAMDVEETSTGIAVSGELDAVLSLSDLLQTVDGEKAMDGSVKLKTAFSGEGRSPGGLVSQLSGKGTLAAGEVDITQFDVPALSTSIQAVQTVEKMDPLLVEALRQGPVRITLPQSGVSLVNGSLRLADTPVTSGGVQGSMKLAIDLTTSRSRIDLTLRQPDPLPPVSMRLSGNHLALDRTYNTRALKSWISNRVLQQGLEQLEELQREEQRLIEEEEKFRVEQVAKEAERQRRIIEQRHARETARRRAAEERERIRSAADARRHAAEQEQRLLKDLIQQNVPSTIPEDAIINPQNSGVRITPPQAAPGTAN